MADSLFIHPQPIQPAALRKDTAAAPSANPSVSFKQVLGDQLDQGGVRFSKHATQRMQSRGIQMSENALARLNQAVRMADEKGSRDSLVLLDSAALVVSIKDNTVVTVADKEQLKGNVFTNIDSAIIA
ncbi:MAG: flagellar protein [Deltaproteobacteria bacterium]|nr:flagellar protein [Deltaproteobacteria bacterium]